MNEMRFEFGENWTDYIASNFSEERLKISKNHLLGFLKLVDLTGRTFIDIGCGSGLHSLAAYRAGAKKVVSVDYDENSVSTTRYLHQREGSPASWEIFRGSVLDREFVGSFGLFDIVYSWGVLHHTGDMWNAIRNATIPLKNNGVYYIALYTTDVHISPTPEFWLSIKRIYNKSNIVIKKMMEYGYASINLSRHFLFQRQNPFNFMKEYKKSRGMSYWHDIRDWLGGWPMEFAGIQETKDFCQNNLGFELLNIRAGEANTEYLFRKKGVTNYWDNYLVNRGIIELNKPFQHRGGYAWMIKFPQYNQFSDSVEQSKRSRLMLFENDVPIGFAHNPHVNIEKYGNGRYSHWHDQLIFSTTDNSDPNNNGRKYSICIDML